MVKFMNIVAMPAFNEEATIGSVVLKSLKQPYINKVIVVDDGSADATSEIAKLAGAEVVRHPVNKGYGAAIISCFEAAKKYNADTLTIIDSDGQHDADDIQKLVSTLKKRKADIVIGSRFRTKEGKEEVPKYREAGIKIINAATHIGGGKIKGVTDTQSGFRTYSKNAIKNLNMRMTGMGISAEILMDASQKKMKIIEVPIKIK